MREKLKKRNLKRILKGSNMGRNENDEVLEMPNKFKAVRLGNSLGNAVADNGSANVTISNVAPAAVGTATIDSWLIVNVDGDDKFIPCWT